MYTMRMNWKWKLFLEVCTCYSGLFFPHCRFQFHFQVGSFFRSTFRSFHFHSSHFLHTILLNISFIFIEVPCTNRLHIQSYCNCDVFVCCLFTSVQTFEVHFISSIQFDSVRWTELFFFSYAFDCNRMYNVHNLCTGVYISIKPKKKQNKCMYTWETYL